MIDIAVFPIAGKGSRLHPLSLFASKEMLPIYNRPMIDYALLAALHAGARQLIMVTHPHKQDIVGYLNRDANQWLDDMLTPFEQSGKIEIIIAYQKEQKGLGHAVYQAKDYVANAPFMVLSPDDIMIGKNDYMRDFVQKHQQYPSANMALIEQIDIAKSQSYGILDIKARDDNIIIANHLVEKPLPSDAPSDYGVIANYILHPNIMEILADLPIGAQGEIQLTDAIAAMMPSTPFIGYCADARRYDCGHIDGLCNAQHAMQHIINKG